MRPITLSGAIVPSLLTATSAQFLNPAPPANGLTTNPAPSATPVPDFTQNPVWAIGSVQQVQWVADVDTYHLRLYQRFVSQQFPDINGYTYSAVGNGTGNQSLAWKVELGLGYLPNTGFSDSASEVFFFEIVPVQSSAQKFDSRYVNITGSKSGTSTASSGSVVSTTANDVFDSGTSTPSSRSGSSDNSGTSETSKLAIGIGVGVGVPVVLLLGIIIGMALMRRKKSSPSISAVAPDDPQPEQSGPAEQVRPAKQSGPAEQSRPAQPQITEFYAPRTDG